MHLDLWLALQIFITAIAALGLAFVFSMQEKDSETRAVSETAILCSFLIDHHPKFSSLQAIADPKQTAVDAETDYMSTIDNALRILRGGGTPRAADEPGRLIAHLKALFASPFFVWIFVYRAYKVRRAYRLARLQHTESRRDDMSKLILIGVMTSIYLYLSLMFSTMMHSGITHAVAVLSVFLGITLALALSDGVVIVYQQQQWKGFWSTALTEIMVLTSSSRDHDLFNQAAILRQGVEASDAVPLPGGIGFYTTVYAVVQAGVIILERHLASVSV